MQKKNPDPDVILAYKTDKAMNNFLNHYINSVNEKMMDELYNYKLRQG